jgi:hypothetical protein
MAPGDFDDEGDERGDIFEGLKFYFSQRLPSRETWKNLVKVRISS